MSAAKRACCCRGRMGDARRADKPVVHPAGDSTAAPPILTPAMSDLRLGSAVHLAAGKITVKATGDMVLKGSKIAEN